MTINSIFFDEFKTIEDRLEYTDSYNNQNGANAISSEYYLNGKSISEAEFRDQLSRLIDWVGNRRDDVVHTTQDQQTNYVRLKTITTYKKYKFPFKLLPAEDRNFAVNCCKFLIGTALTGTCAIAAAVIKKLIF